MPQTFNLPNGRSKGRPLNPKGQANPPHNVPIGELPRCDTPRCRNLASACSAGKCWTCAARRHERERRPQFPCAIMGADKQRNQPGGTPWLKH